MVENQAPKVILVILKSVNLGFLKECAGIEYGKTRRDVMQIAQSVAEEKGVLKKSRITHGWWSRFLQRQGDLSLRRGDSTAHSCMDAINKETLSHYFKLLKDVLDECGLLDNPAQIYNVDESGVPFDFKTPNVVAEIGSKKIWYRQAGKKGQVTIVACANATGQALPPMVIFDAKNLNYAWTKNEVPGTRYGLSDNGWINTDLFEGWLAEHFIRHAVPGRPLLLLLDGHSTHYQPDVIRFARDHDVVMLCLPPHTTHEAQPLDVGVFSSLKSQWTQVCHDYFHKNSGRVITKFNFNLLFSQAWLKYLVPGNIIAGFKKCGVYPYDPKQLWFLVLRRKNNSHEWMKLVAQCLKVTKTVILMRMKMEGVVKMEGVDVVGVMGVMTVGVIKTKTVVPVMNMETMECLLITDIKILHRLIKISWNFMRDVLWKDITCLLTVIMSIGFNCITLKHFRLTVIYV